MGLTEWERKERDGLLALETEQWREKRLVAEDPNTTADVLEQLARTVWDELGHWEHYEPMHSAPDVQANTLLLSEAIFAHPNTPPHNLASLLDRVFSRDLGERTPITKAVCRNPVLPLLILEMPDFWLNLDGETCKALLREETLLPSAIGFLMRHKGSSVEWDKNGIGTPVKDHSVAEAARLHVSQMPPLQTPSEGCKALTAFWKDYCTQQQQDPDWDFEYDYAKEWHAEMVEVGLAPAWMTAFYDNAPPTAPAFPQELLDFWAARPEYAPLLSPDIPPDNLMELARTHIKRNSNHLNPLLLYHPRVTVEVLRYIAENSPSKEVRLHLAAHPLTPSDALVHLVDVPLQRDGWTDGHARDEALKYENALTRRLACQHPNAPLGLADYARRAFVSATELPLSFYPSTSMRLPLVDFVTALRRARPPDILAEAADPTAWTYSLIAALHLPLTGTPLARAKYQRSALDLIRHLSQHGNRFVRWAAQTRLADPDFVFTWQE